LSALRKLADKHKLDHYTYNASTSMAASTRIDGNDKAAPPDSPVDILFLLNMTTEQKEILLSPSLRESTGVEALLYTPSFEHFGIVPLEAMASSLPVIATNTGGPTETILDQGLQDEATTGCLCPPDKRSWANAIDALLALPQGRRRAIGAAGRARVKDKFSRRHLGSELEKACQDAVRIGRPIWTEVGFKKAVAFVLIGWIVLCVGVGAYGYGKYMGWK
jgi:alpha-1,3/alpha-1,6-mannosyltransferase